ncbi:LamG-like jellyroll fold domain-containing protein [Christiangramia sp. LLG6405-1]|uniref:LamG-like jellyroll fold domain-containing protein n=1 Tax=Christiangramia sp. LLG6405-1 TaxID=3160832 RepID=UPI0038690DB5
MGKITFGHRIQIVLIIILLTLISWKGNEAKNLVSNQLENNTMGTSSISLFENTSPNSKAFAQPTARTKTITVQLGTSGTVTIDDDTVDNGSSDPDGQTLTYSTSKTTFDCGDVGNNTVTLTVTNQNNESDSDPATVIVEDNLAPIVQTKNITIQLNASGNATITANQIDNGSSDNCGIANISLDQTSFDCGDVGTKSLTLTVTDDHGNSATKNATVTVQDNIDPTVNTQNITVQLNASGNATITASQIDNGSSDNCGIANISLDQTSFDCNDVGNNTVELTVTDDHGNSATKNATVTIQDNTNPTVNTQNITVQLDASGNASITANDIDNGSSDNCGIANISLDQTSFDCNDVGNNTVQLTVTDDHGNSATKNATVSVEDNIDPTARTRDITIRLDASGNASITANDIDNGSSDNCGIANISLDQTSFDCNDVGNNTVQLTVTDDHGNSASETASVIVEDKVAPIVQTKNITVELDASGNVTIAEDAVNDNSSDACGGLSFDTDITSFDCDDVGNNSVILTVTDEHGNSASESASVIIEDNILPEQPNLSAITWKCGEDIVEIPTTNDNCVNSIQGTTTDPLQYDAFGTYTITWTFTDPSGNSVSADQNIIIPEPVVDVPSEDGSHYCNEEIVDAINFTGNDLDNKYYEWSYKSESGSSIDIGMNTSGSGNIPSFTAENNGSEVIEAVFTIIPFGNGCQGESVNFSLFIEPTPTMTKPDDIVVCAGENVSRTNFPNRVFSVSGSTVTWTNDNTSIGLSASGNGSVDSFTATNNTNEPLTANITVNPSANGCSGVPQTFTIEVKPIPGLDIPEIPELCNAQSFSAIPLNGNYSGITYDISGGTSIGLSNRTGVTEIPDFTPVNNSNTIINSTLRIIPKANGCIGEVIEIPVSVKPSPAVNTTYTNQICSEEQTDLSISSPVANTSYTWTVDAPSAIVGAENGSFEIADDKLIQQQLVNNSSAPQIVTYRITPQANGCSGTTIPVKITVNPTPEFEINLPNCPTSVDFTDSAVKNNSSLNYSYWEDEAATIEINNPTELYLGTYYIKGQSDAGCALIKEVIVDKVKPVITNLNDSPTEICSGDAFDFLPESNLEDTTIDWSRAAVGDNPATNSSDRNNINPNESLVNNSNNSITAIYIFTLEKNGCTNDIAVEVEVAPAPQLIEENIQDICNGSSINYTPRSSLSNSSINWRRNAFEGNSASSGSGNIDEILYNDTGVEIGVTYFITITSAEGCSVEESISFSLLSGPKVSATSSKNNICAGETVDLFSTFEGEQSVDPVLLDENFNGSTTNWQSINNSSGGNLENAAWKKRNGTHNMNYGSVRSDGSSFYITDSDAQGQNGNTRTILLYNEPLNTIGYSSLELSFWQDYRDWDNNDRGRVQVSTNKSDWTTVETINGSGHRDENTTVDLSGFIGQEELYIRFNYRANWGYWWAIDDVKITGEGSTIPDVTWTSSTNPDWTSNEPNPTNISISRTTIFTATYTDPEIECPGVGTVEVTVKEPLQPEIIANYCSIDQTNQILLSVDGNYDTYRWVVSGQTISTEESLQVSLAQTYTLYVTRDGCEASTSITPNENLITNGDFENGNSGFNTVYGYVEDIPNFRREMYPEGLYAIGENAYNYHNNFSGLGHGGRGNFMIVNGDRSIGNIVWQSNTLDIIPETDYYFSAWTSNVNPASPARLRIQVLVNNSVVVESNLGDLTNQPVGNWINFYNPELWNSGNNTQVVVRIINENPTAGGNDFGIDDISFSAFRSFDFEFEPDNNGPVCESETIELAANLDGGRLPITFNWTGPNGFSQSKTITEEGERDAADTIQLSNSTTEMSGQYTLQITDFYGCNLESKSTTVEVIQKAIVNAGSDMEVCSSEPLVNLSTATIDHPTINSGFWSTIDGDNSRFTDPNNINTTYNPSENEISSGEIALVLTSDQDAGAICATVSDTINIIFNISPEVELVSKNVSCFGGTDGNIEVNILENTGTGPFTYTWSNGQTGKIVTNLSAGDYYVEITDSKSCAVISDTLSILQPEELLVENPIHMEEASCFDEFGTVIAIPVQGGLFAEEILDDENFPYMVEILDNAGNEVSQGQDQIDYDFNTQRFIISGLQGGMGYTFLISSGENCAAEVKTLTTLTPPVINAGEVPEISDCGIKTVWLAATPVDPEIGIGSWSYNNGDVTMLGNPNDPNSSFTGEAGETYTLVWNVLSTTNPDCNVFDEIEVTFAPNCSKLNFDGVDDYVDAGNNYSMRGSDFSIEAWVKPNAITGINTILSKREVGNDNLGYDLFINDGTPTFRVRSRSVSGTKKINTDRWYHIAGVYTANKMTLYVDGIEIQNNTNNIPNGSGNFDAPFLIGATHAPAEAKQTKQHFNGFIEEVRVWEKPLSKEHIRFFMNQRLDNSGSSVTGEILTQDLNLPNAPTLTNSSDLRGYYQLLARENLISTGKTPNLGSEGTSADGLLKNIQMMQENTAPLPYILNTNNNNWFEKSTWRLPSTYEGISINRVDVWNSPGSKGINGDAIEWNIVQLNGNSVKNPGTNSNANKIKLLALELEDGNLNMEGKYEESGNELFISHYLELDGAIDLNGESQLIQSEGSKISVSNSGYLDRDQQGTQNSFNYNYWTSPVSNPSEAVNSGFHIDNVLWDGSTSEAKPIAFDPWFQWADANYNGNLRISSYWLYTFQGTVDNYFEWSQVSMGNKIKAGIGYTMKGTNGYVPVSNLQNYTFRGVPNNGDITVGVGSNQNLLTGNPYPSAIDANAFINDNLNDFNGTIYLWDHFGPSNSHYLEEYVGGYAIYNLSGGVASATSKDARINNDGSKSSKSRPGRYIPVAQGFFINTKGVSSPSSVTFRNAHRVYAPEYNSDSQFHSQEEDPKKSSENEYEEDTRYKIRLKLESPKGYHRQILVTADVNTTDGFDLGYDAPLIENNVEDLYWMIDESEFIIQGVPDFSEARVLPVGFKIAEAGEYTIKVDELENIPNDFEIYLLNTKTEEYHDLMKSDYTVSTDSVGVFNEKYQIVFQKIQEENVSEEEEEEEDVSEEVVEEKPEVEEDSDPDFLDMRYLRQTDEIALYNPDLQNINFVELYSVSGQKIMTFSDIPTEESISLRIQQKLSSAVYVVKIYVGEKIYSKKVIITK